MIDENRMQTAASLHPCQTTKSPLSIGRCCQAVVGTGVAQSVTYILNAQCPIEASTNLITEQTQSLLPLLPLLA